MIWVLAAAGAALGIWRAVFALHMLQQDSYNNTRFLKWTLARPWARWIAQYKRGPAKKPLVWTGRAMRIFAAVRPPC